MTTPASGDACVAAIDIGTASVRSAIVTADGTILARATADIAVNRPEKDHREQSSDEIWAAICTTMRRAVAEAGIAPAAVRGLSVDTTSCTLVFLDGGFAPVCISGDGDPRWNVIQWADHRAVAEAEECTATGHRMLRHVGGVMSPEMQVPKCLWVKRQRPQAWARTAHVFDLADFVTWKCTGDAARSACTLTCKWGYLGHEDAPWPDDFLAAVGLEDGRARTGVPARATPVGRPIGRLSAAAAEALGLGRDCVVAAGLIDAHAGVLGVLGAAIGAADGGPVDDRIGLIAGTSTCHMALSPEPRFIPGVWGPYLGAVVPGMWVNEGGQSATGALLDHVIQLHGGTPTPAAHRALIERVAALRRADGFGLDPELMVLPDFHGNRSPLADAHARGVVSGLTMDASDDALARLYFATCLAIVYGTRHIIDAMNAQGFRIDHLHLTGGHARNPLLVELYASATGCTVVLPEQEDGVLLGAAILAASGCGLHQSPAAAARAMVRTASSRWRSTRSRTSIGATRPSCACTSTGASWPRSSPVERGPQAGRFSSTKASLALCQPCFTIGRRAAST
ncbi:MAG: FGGY-family carbohydrate kinase [Alphaproteobacteria bacterium]